MDNYLRLTLYTDGDGTAEVRAAIQCNGFCGNSAAWFGIKQLEEFCEQLLTYPLPTEGLPPLQGGFWSRAQRGQLDQLLVSMRIYPVGLRGAVGCFVTLRTPLNDGDATKVASVVEVELRTSYQELSVFSAQLKQLAQSQAAEAILRGVVI